MTLQAKDIRIGNYVQLVGNNWRRSYRNTIATVKGKDIVNLSVDALAQEDYAPIPLTEEWLVKFGLKKEQNLRVSSLATWGTLSSDSQSWFSIIAHNDDYSFDSPHFNNAIRFVHQLQNIYFALTGDELTTHPTQ
jgi:hypothetical protein